jgi:hypothetical protein
MADKDKTSKDTEKSKVDLGLLEEDDEFEEFPAESELSQNFKITNYNDKQFF